MRYTLITLLAASFLGCGAPAAPETRRAPPLRSERGQASPVGSGRPARAGSDPGAGSCVEASSEIARLVEHLDEDADPLHSDMTPAVWALSQGGAEAACAVLPSLESPDSQTRIHAQRVLEGILSTRCNFRPGRGFADQLGEEATEAIARRIGYRHDMPEAERRIAVQRWRRWAENGGAQTCERGAAAEVVTELREELERVHPALSNCGEPVDIRVTVGSNGRVARVGSNDRGQSYHRCVSEALASVRVTPFERDSIWVDHNAVER